MTGLQGNKSFKVVTCSWASPVTHRGTRDLVQCFKLTGFKIKTNLDFGIKPNKKERAPTVDDSFNLSTICSHNLHSLSLVDGTSSWTRHTFLRADYHVLLSQGKIVDFAPVCTNSVATKNVCGNLVVVAYLNSASGSCSQLPYLSRVI